MITDCITDYIKKLAVGNIRPCSEFNFFVDPEAAFVVLASSWGESNLIVVPLETCKLAMSTLVS